MRCRVTQVELSQKAASLVAVADGMEGCAANLAGDSGGAVYLNFDQLRAKLGNRGRTSIYRDIESGRLPPPIKIGTRSYWIECVVDRHIAALVDGEAA